MYDVSDKLYDVRYNVYDIYDKTRAEADNVYDMCDKMSAEDVPVVLEGVQACRDGDNVNIYYLPGCGIPIAALKTAVLLERDLGTGNNRGPFRVRQVVNRVVNRSTQVKG